MFLLIFFLNLDKQLLANQYTKTETVKLVKYTNKNPFKEL